MLSLSTTSLTPEVFKLLVALVCLLNAMCSIRVSHEPVLVSVPHYVGIKIRSGIIENFCDGTKFVCTSVAVSRSLSSTTSSSTPGGSMNRIGNNQIMITRTPNEYIYINIHK